MKAEGREDRGGWRWTKGRRGPLAIMSKLKKINLKRYKRGI